MTEQLIIEGVEGTKAPGRGDVLLGPPYGTRLESGDTPGPTRRTGQEAGTPKQGGWASPGQSFGPDERASFEAACSASFSSMERPRKAHNRVSKGSRRSGR